MLALKDHRNDQVTDAVKEDFGRNRLSSNAGWRIHALLGDGGVFQSPQGSCKSHFELVSRIAMVQLAPVGWMECSNVVTHRAECAS